MLQKGVLLRSKQKPQHPQAKMNMATLRLKKDIFAFSEEKIDFVTLIFPQENNLQTIRVSICPQPGSLYENTTICFELVFPDSYPIDPPKLKCLNRVFHPNISHEGHVCLPLVRQDYEPTVTLGSIISGLIFILTYPNAEDALNPDIGELMEKKPNILRKILDCTNKGGCFKDKNYDCIFQGPVNKFSETDLI